MKNIYKFPNQDQILDEASIWIARLDRGLSDEEYDSLRDWLANDARHRETLMELATLWDRMDSLSRLSDLFQEPPRRSEFFGKVLRIAAVLAVIGIGVWVSVDELPWVNAEIEILHIEPQPQLVYETAIGEQSTANLPDGSEIVLNTNSLLRVHYSPTHRVIRLERGELHVRVADDVDRPFSVIAGDNVIQAVGTEFNIEISDNQLIELVVTEGRVLVGVHRPQSSTTVVDEPAVLPMSSTSVAAGEELMLGTDVEIVTEVSPVDMQVKLSWQSGNLIFQGESLEDALVEIGRYTSVEFIIQDDDLRNVRVVGLFKAGDVNGLLAALRENFEIAYRRSGEQIILMSSN